MTPGSSDAASGASRVPGAEVSAGSATPGTPSSDGSGSRKPGPRAKLSRARIVEAAFAVADRTGSLSYKAIGAELGVHPTGIYRYFADQDDLLLGLIDALHAEVDVLEEKADRGPSLDGEDGGTPAWRADLESLAEATYAAFLSHPHVARYAGARTARQSHEFTQVDRVIGDFLAAGFAPARAAALYRSFSDVVLGLASVDAELAALSADLREKDAEAWAADYAHPDGAALPHLARVAAHLPALGDAATFRHTVAVLLDGVQAQARS